MGQLIEAREPEKSANDNSELAEEIRNLKEDIKRQMRAVDRLQAGNHEHADAEQHLDTLLQLYSSLVHMQDFPPRE